MNKVLQLLFLRYFRNSFHTCNKSCEIPVAFSIPCWIEDVSSTPSNRLLERLIFSAHRRHSVGILLFPEAALHDEQFSGKKASVIFPVRRLLFSCLTCTIYILPSVPQKSKTWNRFNYFLIHEKYLKTFLGDGEVPMDNNAAEQSIRGFCEYLLP